MIHLNCETLVEALIHHAECEPDRSAYHLLAPGRATPTSVVTFGGLDRQACAIAVALWERYHPGDRALLLYPPGLEFIAGFFGCLYAGIVPLPTYPPDPVRMERTLPRLESIAADADASILLSTTPLLSFADSLLGDSTVLSAVDRLATDGNGESAAETGWDLDIDIGGDGDSVGGERHVRVQLADEVFDLRQAGDGGEAVVQRRADWEAHEVSGHVLADVVNGFVFVKVLTSGQRLYVSTVRIPWATAWSIVCSMLGQDSGRPGPPESPPKTEQWSAAFSVH